MTKSDELQFPEKLGIINNDITPVVYGSTTSPDEISSDSSDAAAAAAATTTRLQVVSTTTTTTTTKEDVDGGSGKGGTSVLGEKNRNEANGVGRGELDVLRRSSPARPLSMSFLRGLMCCQECNTSSGNNTILSTVEYDEKHAPSELYNLQALKRQSSSISPLVMAPMLHNTRSTSQEHLPLIESLIGEYVAACRVYGCSDRINAGVLTTIRFSLPSLRVGGDFHDADVLALTEVLLRHANGALNYIQRLDFTIASQEGRGRHNNSKLGFTSHGAFAISKVLQQTRYVQEVFLPRHRIGPYGASAIFMACSTNPTITTLGMRGCWIGERGALAFAELICPSSTTGLVDVDLSANVIGFRGTSAIDRALLKREQSTNIGTVELLQVNLEGNHVFPEIMNSCTHCLGVILSIIGGILLSKRIEGLSTTHAVSCAIYTTSLLVLYTSSTLYHSFFALQGTKYIFEVLDKSAIYILIAGSYTPFLSIVLHDITLWSVYLLGFMWTCSFLGICVEACYPTWKYRMYFSLLMYLGMGWSALACLPEIARRLPDGAVNYILLGGVGYTVGVPFFVRDNNLDHAIWHLFVLSGSIFHWIVIYIYVAPRPLGPSPEE